MEVAKRALAGFPGWNQTPIPGLSLSAAGLLALADLSTAARRTAITGGSSWLDSLVLVPGLHYQQAADELARGPGARGLCQAVETEPDGTLARRPVRNAATAQFLAHVARPDEVVTVDVGMLPQRARRGFTGQKSSRRATVWTTNATPDLGWLSHLLYLVSPVLTVAALTLMILLNDWWSFGFLIALMISRILNIWVIKQRSKPTDPVTPPRSRAVLPQSRSGQSHPLPPIPQSPRNLRSSPTRLQKRTRPNSASTGTSAASSPAAEPPHHVPRPAPSRLATLRVDLPDGRRVALRGMSDDLAAVTITPWLAARTHVQGYLEAAAKLLVYLVAALSGNATQAGALLSLVLLLVSAALLALSNAHARGLRVNGRTAALYLPASGGPGAGSGQAADRAGGGTAVEEVEDGGGARRRMGRRGDDGRGQYDVPWSADGRGPQTNGWDDGDDWAERGQAGRRAPDGFRFDDSVDYDETRDGP